MNRWSYLSFSSTDNGCPNISHKVIGKLKLPQLVIHGQRETSLLFSSFSHVHHCLSCGKRERMERGGREGGGEEVGVEERWGHRMRGGEGGEGGERGRVRQLNHVNSE